MAALTGLLLFAGVLAVGNSAKDWTYYDGPETLKPPAEWKSLYPDCGKKSQSPINIVPSQVKYDKNLTGFILKGGFDDKTETTVKIDNTGYSLVFEPDAAAELTVSGGGLPGEYKLAQFHLHWGDDDDKGSEHTLSGKQEEAEVHYVFYNTKHGSVKEAKKHADGLAVLGTFVECSCKKPDPVPDNPLMKTVQPKLASVSKPDDPKQSIKLKVGELLPSDRTSYYRYSGSLTTPPCSEAVIWSIFTQPVYFSKAQMEELRKGLYSVGGDKTKLVNNYRPVQPLNGREVKASFMVTSGGVVLSSQFACVAALVMAALYYL